jgi:hypothetical protein
MWLDRYLSSSGFADAMIETGWLVEKNGIVSFSKFDRWNSQGAKRRLNAAKRQQNKRFNGHALVTKMSRSKRDENVTREEKRREEKKEEKNTPLPPTAELAVIEKFNPLTAPLPFDSPGFRLAWGEWVEYRRVRKPALTESSVLKQLKHLAELAEPDAIRCIENSIANQWQGLFPEKHAAKPNSRPASRGESQDAYAARLAATAFGGST